MHIRCKYYLSGDQLPEFESGSVRVFVKGADGRWSQQAKLTSDDSKEGDFGDNVSLSADGSTALIGSSAGVFSFSAYVFVKGTDGRWIQQAKFSDLDINFGSSVSLSANGGTALIGTNFSSYVFVRGTTGSWSQQAKIIATKHGGGHNEVSLSANGDTALIGISDNDDQSGEAYIFVKGTSGTWSRQIKLTAADGAAGDHFGNEVSLSADGRMALIGADSGAAYIFAKGADGNWGQQVKLTAADDAAMKNFGYKVSLSGDGGTALIRGGAAAYIYSSTAAPLPASKPAAVKP